MAAEPRRARAALALGIVAALGSAAPPIRARPGVARDSESLALDVPAKVGADEQRALRVAIGVRGGHGAARIFLEDLPPGAVWDEPRGELSFVPDFTQGGTRYQVSVTAQEGAVRVHAVLEIAVADTVAPPSPRVTRTEELGAWSRLEVTQTTDAFLDSPGLAGRDFGAVVTAPRGAASRSLPVRVDLHGFAGAPNREGSDREIRIAPSDPHNTYWWGYAPASGPAQDYTVRRVLHLLAWVLATQPAADPDRVYVDGASMGGAGAMALGLLHARHFCFVRATHAQAFARGHRPSRVSQLTPLWGAPPARLDDGPTAGVWDLLDMTRAVRSVPEARDQLLSLHHGKDDPTIHFDSVVGPSPLTGTSFYAALQREHVGHEASWDEGGHLVPDPALAARWWTDGFNPVFDATTRLARRTPFAAFSSSSADDHPGEGLGNGRRPWSAERGFAGAVAAEADTGWDGDRSGARNRYLRWDGLHAVDTLERLELPLRVQGRSAPVVVDVTPRRAAAFRCRPSERIRFTFGSRSGVVVADAHGELTVPRLEVGTTWTTLALLREP